jgi:glyoxylase-like metal-dependent hydrolase (beta-lactamase superfamily II)
MSEPAEQTVTQRVTRIEMPTHYPVGPVNVFLVEDDALTLVDAGLNNDACWNLLEQGVRDAGYAVADIERILLTHGHTDHVGLLPRLLEETNAEVAAQTYCAERLRDPEMGEALASAFIFKTLEECGVPADRV